MTAANTCARSKCTRLPFRYGVCGAHYRHIPHGFVDSAAARKHLHQLRRKGLGLAAITAMSGISDTTLDTLEAGRKLIRRATEVALLAVPVPKKIVDGQALLPAVGTTRRLDALLAAGYPQSFIADHFGVRIQVISRMRQNTVVTTRYAVAVAELFDQLHMIPGPSDRARRCARIRGLLPALAWDEDTIDDPAAEPYIGAGVDDLADRIADERAIGYDDAEVAARWGMKLDTLQQKLRRAGIPRTDFSATDPAGLVGLHHRRLAS